MVKNLPAMQQMWVRSLGWEDPLILYLEVSEQLPIICNLGKKENPTVLGIALS